MGENRIVFEESSYKELVDIIYKEKGTLFVNFFNGNDVASYFNIPEFAKCLNDSKIKNINNIDGISVAIPLSFKNLRRVKRLPGPTFTDKFLKEDKNKDKKHFFIGIEEYKLKEVLKRYSSLKKKNIFGYNLPYISGFFFPAKEINKIVSLINKNDPDFLWIGMGSPKQQILAHQIYKKIKVNRIFNVGVAMEFIKGTKKRAPYVFRKIGAEWVYRMFFSQFKLTTKRLPATLSGAVETLFIGDLKND